MTTNGVDPLLDHLEKTFSEAYRKEIDQEENIWRSLPFFAATLALQMAALGQVRDWVGRLVQPMLAIATGLLSLTGAATLAAVLFLARSVWPADFKYVAREPDFRLYAQEVLKQARETEDANAVVSFASTTALAAIKATLVDQYAMAVDNNRAINQRRAKWRTRAGLATLTSVCAVLVLAALTVVDNIHAHGK